jgi:hypothetical protein
MKRRGKWNLDPFSQSQSSMSLVSRDGRPCHTLSPTTQIGGPTSRLNFTLRIRPYPPKIQPIPAAPTSIRTALFTSHTHKNTKVLQIILAIAATSSHLAWSPLPPMSKPHPHLHSSPNWQSISAPTHLSKPKGRRGPVVAKASPQSTQRGGRRARGADSAYPTCLGQLPRRSWRRRRKFPSA